MSGGKTHLKPHEARILGATNAFTEAAPMVECHDQPCTFLVQRVDGFRCPECREIFCTDHRGHHYCPASKDRQMRESSERRTESWRQGKLGFDNLDQLLIDAERGFGYGPLYHVRRKGRWYYYRFQHISAFWGAVSGEMIWSVWATRTNKDGDDDLGFTHLEMENLTEIEPAE